MATHQNIQHAIGAFPTQDRIESALNKLRERDFPVAQVSVVAKHTEDENAHLSGIEVRETVGTKAGETARTGAITGGIGGALVGALEALGASTTLALLPGAGQVMLFGTVAANALATAVVGGAAGAAGGGLLGGLMGWGVPEKHAKLYQERVATGQYLLMLEGTENQIAAANQVLNPQGIQEWHVYNSQFG